MTTQPETDHDYRDAIKSLTTAALTIARLEAKLRVVEAERDGADDVIARVDALAGSWLTAMTWDGKPARVDRAFGGELRKALKVDQ